MPYSHEILPLIEPEYYNKLTKPEAVRLGSEIFQLQNHPTLHAELYTLIQPQHQTHTAFNGKLQKHCFKFISMNFRLSGCRVKSSHIFSRGWIRDGGNKILLSCANPKSKDNSKAANSFVVLARVCWLMIV